MKDVLVRAGSSLLATVIAYIGLTLFAEGLEVPLRVAVALGMGVAAFAVAVWAATGNPKDLPGSAQVASSLKGASANIEDVRVDSAPGQEVRIASNIETTGPIDIKRASIGSGGDKK